MHILSIFIDIFNMRKCKIFPILIVVFLQSQPSIQELPSPYDEELELAEINLPNRPHPRMNDAHYASRRFEDLASRMSGMRAVGLSGNNATMDQLAVGLSRLEGNLASLIQSFLVLQRSVFNLEQLQELLVLLLEDILKQVS